MNYSNLYVFLVSLQKRVGADCDYYDSDDSRVATTDQKKKKKTKKRKAVRQLNLEVNQDSGSDIQENDVHNSTNGSKVNSYVKII